MGHSRALSYYSDLTLSKPFSQWQRSFQRNLRSYWLTFVRQRHVIHATAHPAFPLHFILPGQEPKRTVFSNAIGFCQTWYIEANYWWNSIYSTANVVKNIFDHHTTILSIQSRDKSAWRTNWSQWIFDMHFIEAYVSRTLISCDKWPYSLYYYIANQDMNWTLLDAMCNWEQWIFFLRRFIWNTMRKTHDDVMKWKHFPRY